MMTSMFVAFAIFSAAVGHSQLTTVDDDSMKFAFSLTGCGSKSSDIASVARVHVGTLQDNPVRVQLAAATTMVHTSRDETTEMKVKEPQNWSTNITVRKHEPGYVTIPSLSACSSPNNSDINDNGILISANGTVDVYIVIGCLPISERLCSVRSLKPISHLTTDQLYIFPDSSVDKTTFQPRRIVVNSFEDNTTIRVIRFGTDQNLNVMDLNSTDSMSLHTVVVNSFQTYSFDIGETVTLEQLMNGYSPTGDIIGIVASKPVSVFLEHQIDGPQNVVVQLEPTNLWGKTFVAHRPPATHNYRDEQRKSFARIIAGHDATTVRVQYWRSQFSVSWIHLPAGYRHIDVDISAGLQSGGIVEFFADHPISLLQLTVTRRPYSTRSETTIVSSAGNPVEPATDLTTEMWLTSSCDETANASIWIMAVDGDLDVHDVEMDGEKIPVDGVHRLQKNGNGREMQTGNVSSLMVPGVKTGLHAIRLLRINVTRHIYVGCRYNGNGASTSATTAYQNRPESTTQSQRRNKIVDNITESETRRLPRNDSLPTTSSKIMTSNISLELRETLFNVTSRNESSKTALKPNGSVNAWPSVVIRDKKILIHTVAAKACANGSSAYCARSSGLTEALNYSDLSPDLSSFNILIPNDVAAAAAAATNEHFFHHIVSEHEPSANLISSPTVIAVIASLVVAIFFVIACIVGFVVAELVCSKGGLQRVKVSPFVDDYE